MIYLLQPNGQPPEHLYYVPQHFGQYDDRTIAQALRIDGKLKALHAILNGDVSENISPH